MRFHLTKHCREKAAAVGVSIDDLLDLLAWPETTYPAFESTTGKKRPRRCRSCGEQQQTWTGTTSTGKFAVAVFPCCNTAITVFADQRETNLRPDQREAGVTGYVGRDGAWRS